MKNIRSLIMLLIGMISFTTLATTPVLEQKQKALTTVVDVVQPVYADVVQDVITVQVAILSEYNNSRSFTNKDYPKTNYFAVVTDVGWCFVGDSKNIPTNRANLKYSYLPDIEKEMLKLGLKHSRDNC